MKAYLVNCEWLDEDNSRIRFADHSVTARREGACQLEVEFCDVTCRRAPEFDEFAPGPVPMTVLIKHGWWMECMGCGIRVDDDPYDHDKDEPLDLDPVDHGSVVFCTPACKEKWLADKAMEKRITVATIQWLESELLQKLPEAEIVEDGDRLGTYVYVDRGTVVNGRISFRFPGCEIGPAHFAFNGKDEAPVVTVCSGDMDAFNAWRAA